MVRPDTRDVPIDAIDDPELPSRSDMDDQKLDDLVESIRAVGLINALSVARVGERFEVLAGHRRLIACRRAGLTMVSCRVYPSKDVDLTLVQAHENARREDLNPADEALWFMQLLDGPCGGDFDKLCSLVGEKASYVNDRIALYHGDQDVFAALKAKTIRVGVANALNTCDDAHFRKYFLACAVRGGATVAVVTGWIQQWKQARDVAPPAPPSDQPVPLAAMQPAHDPFACYVCGKSDPRFIPLTIYVHQHCQLAILDPLLKSAAGES